MTNEFAGHEFSRSPKFKENHNGKNLMSRTFTYGSREEDIQKLQTIASENDVIIVKIAGSTIEIQGYGSDVQAFMKEIQSLEQPAKYTEDVLTCFRAESGKLNKTRH